jgi:hypothetical protein
MTPAESAAFQWTLIGFVGLVILHAAYWIITHPVNKFWLKDQNLKGFRPASLASIPLSSEARRSETTRKRGSAYVVLPRVACGLVRPCLAHAHRRGRDLDGECGEEAIHRGDVFSYERSPITQPLNS